VLTSKMLTSPIKHGILNSLEGRADFLCHEWPLSMRGLPNRFPSNRRTEAFLLEEFMPKGLKGFQMGHAGFREKITVKRICQYCEKPIFVIPAVVRIGSGKFCDAACYGKWQSENRRLEKSYSWKYGSEHTYRSIARDVMLVGKNSRICSLCGRKQSIIVHHKDMNIKNNSVNNLQVLCQSCHVKLHYKMSGKTGIKSRHFICSICHKEFIGISTKDRKVCSTKCSYAYSRLGLHWRNREH
jgi:5-methylcytosine-specific restriction endonuclease McrA